MTDAPHRPLSGLERVWLAADRLAPPFVNQCVLTHLPPLFADRLAFAVERAAAAHPGVRVRLAGVLRDTRWVADGPGPRFRTLPDTRWTARSEPDAPFLNTALSAATGPICEVLWLPGDTPSTRHVVVRTHHAALDGRGTQLFIEDLLAAYEGGVPRGAEAGPTFDLDLAQASGTSARPRPEPPPDAIAPTGAAAASSRHTWRRVSVPGVARPVLPRVVHALAAAADSLGNSGLLRIGLPVDLRRYAPGLRSSANLTGVAAISLPTPLPSVTALAELLSAAADGPDATGHVLAGDRLRSTPLWLITLAGRLAAPSLRKRGRYPISASVSNLGRHAWHLEGKPIRAFWIPPPSPGLPLFLSLCGDAEHLEICAAAPVGLADAGRLDALLAAMVTRL